MPENGYIRRAGRRIGSGPDATPEISGMVARSAPDWDPEPDPSEDPFSGRSGGTGVRGDTSCSAKIGTVIFASKDSSFRIFRVTDRDTGEEFTCKGNVGDIVKGIDVKLRGRFVTDRKWGRQFLVSSCEDEMSVDTMGHLLKTVPGIGPVLASRLVDRFGEDLADIIATDPSRLAEAGATDRVIEAIVRVWGARWGEKGLRELLKIAGMGDETTERFVAQAAEGDGVLALEKKIRENPWAITLEGDDETIVSFAQADRIARYLGFPMDDPARARCGVAQALRIAGASGHCWMSREKVREMSAKALSGIMTGSAFEICLDWLKEKGVVEEEDGKLYLSGLYHAEKSIAAGLADLAHEFSVPDDIIESLPRRFSPRGDPIVLNAEQESAVKSACSHTVSIVTGGPGTGKTAVVRSIIDAVRNLGGEGGIYLCAPTGKAAQRLSELSGMKASTIHRLLGMRGEQNDEVKNIDNPLPARLVIVDEASMLDCRLMEKLVEAIPNGCRIVFSGDVDQLPPVGPGNVLRDLIDSETIPVTRLSHIYRQSEKSFISQNARAINQGDYEAMEIDDAEDFDFVECRDAQTAANEVISICKELTDNGTSPMDIMVAVPMNRGDLGVRGLNDRLQSVMNPDGREVARSFGSSLRIGDKIIQTRNNYKKNVFNGELGTITGAREEGGFLCDFGNGRTVEYDEEDAPQLSLAYAMTIHKSQGSEVDNVILAISSANSYMLDRSLLYTGVTRARKFCAVVGDEAALRRAVGRSEATVRNTSLIERLQNPGYREDDKHRKTVEEAVGDTGQIRESSFRIDWSKLREFAGLAGM